jgi:chromosome segregation ATPase
MSNITPASASLVSRLIDSRPTTRVSSRPHQPSLAYTRRTVFREIAKLRTKLAKLDNKITRLNEQATLANDTANSARARVRYLTLQIAQRNREETEGNFGNEYARSLRHYNDYTRTNPNDEEGIRSRYNEANRLHGILDAYIQENITSLRVEAQSMLRTITKEQDKYITLNERIVELTRQKDQLEFDLNNLLADPLALNENLGRGKKQRRFTHKRGKKRKH